MYPLLKLLLLPSQLASLVAVDFLDTCYPYIHSQDESLPTSQVLEAIEEELKSGRSSESKLSELTSKFYTIIPHHFGRRVPPVIGDAQTLQNKFDMLIVSFACRWR